MKLNSRLQAGLLAFSAIAASALPAFADDYGPAPGYAPRYDSQIAETRALNLQALDDALEQNEDGGVTVENVSLDDEPYDGCDAQGSGSDASCGMSDDEEEVYDMPGTIEAP